ncbi:single-stranded DNA-binding protein, partial [Pasteurella multocida]
GVNKVIIVGNLGQNPDYKVMTNGDPVTNISVATSEVWADKASGEKREVVEWHRITIYRRQADIAAQFLKKGSKVYVEGRLKTRKWQ